MSGSVPLPDFLAVFRAHADAAGTMSFAQFMEIALYHPVVGYYRQDRERVGYAAGTDFYTASTSGPLFGELIAAACSSLLQTNGRDPALHTFVEIGAESSQGVLAGVAHPFGACRTIRLGEPIDLTGDCVVFSNELFDAQPCNRTLFRDGRWLQLGVRLDGTTLSEVELDTVTHPGAPDDLPDGYHFDRPEAATTLVETLAAAPWRGLFVAFDYGKTLRQLLAETPAGTARAYFRHTQSNSLLSNPGNQDLTCHVCWDWLESALTCHGFASTALVSQESFFIRNAGEFIAKVSTAEAARFSPRKLALLQLLHPAHLGQKFQVLHAFR